MILVNDFQKWLYETLNTNQKLKKCIKNIHLTVTQDGEMPFLLINIDNIKNTFHSYSIDFQIISFAKDQNYKVLLNIGELVIDSISSSTKYFSHYLITGIKEQKTEFSKAHDLVSNKINIQYKALIKKYVS